MWGRAAPAAGVLLVMLALLHMRGKLRRCSPWRPFLREIQMRRGQVHFLQWVDQHAWTFPLNTLPFTMTLTCETSASALMNRFDWKVVPLSAFAEIKPHDCRSIDDMPWRDNPVDKDPRTVWATPHALPRLLDLAEAHFDKSRSDRAVVFSGSEMPLSAALGSDDSERNATVRRLQKYFSRISMQNLDEEHEQVHLAPMGLGWGYMQAVLARLHRQGSGWSGFFRSIWGPRVPKTRDVLAAWGAVAGWLDQRWALEKATRMQSIGRLFPPSNSSPKAVINGHYTRTALKSLVKAGRLKAAGVEHRSLNSIEWWVELPKYRFLLCPIGAAIQSAKVYEALLVGTVPIVHHALFLPVFRQLQALGFPIAITDAWYYVTRENLTRWWAELSPRLESFRRHCMTADGYWRIFTGAVKRCE